MKDKAFVYIVQCNDDSYYTGWTYDTKRRVEAHNGIIAGGAKYTRNKRPVKLIWQESCSCKQEAQSIEQRIKNLTRAQKVRLIKEGFYIKEWHEAWEKSNKN